MSKLSEIVLLEIHRFSISFFLLLRRSSGPPPPPQQPQAPPDVPAMVGVAGSMYPQINPIDKLYLMQNSYFDH